MPVQPTDIGEHTPGEPADPVAFSDTELETYLDEHLDPVVDFLADRGVYAIIDYHRHWAGLEWGDQEAETINESLQDEALLFWESVAQRYGESDHVLFEAYNEPTEPGMWGEIGQEWVDSVWSLFLEFMQPIVDEIREHTDTVTLVGSPSWTQSPEGALIEPVAADNIAYTYHIYPGHEASEAEDWDDSSINGQGVEEVYEEFPLFVTEFGWRQYDDDLLSGSVEEFGEPFLEWMESHDSIHWTAWCADVWWEPAMFDTGFEETDEDIGNPYEEEVPVACEQRPCEWNLLGADGGADGDAGEFIQRALEASGVPSTAEEEGEDDDDEVASEGDTDDDDETDGTDADADSEEPDSGPEEVEDDIPGFGILTGAAGVAGGTAYLLRERVQEAEPNKKQ